MMFPNLCNKSAVTWAVCVTLVQSLSTLADGSCMGGSRGGVLSYTHMMSLQNCLAKVQRDHIKTSLSLLRQRLTSEIAFVRCYMVGWLQMNLTARSIPFPHNALKCMFNPFVCSTGWIFMQNHEQPMKSTISWDAHVKLNHKYTYIVIYGYYFHVMADFKFDAVFCKI